MRILVVTANNIRYDRIKILSKLMTVVLFVIVSSCCGLRTKITYEYNGTKIKRIDVCGKTTFYYNDIHRDAVKIWVEYSGINDGFSGYLVFKEKGKVELISSDGYFQTKNADNSKFEYIRMLKPSQKPDLGGTVYFVTTAKTEKKRNANIDTEIKVEYNIDENEWW